MRQSRAMVVVFDQGKMLDICRWIFEKRATRTCAACRAKCTRENALVLDLESRASQYTLHVRVQKVGKATELLHCEVTIRPCLDFSESWDQLRLKYRREYLCHAGRPWHSPMVGILGSVGLATLGSSIGHDQNEPESWNDQTATGQVLPVHIPRRLPLSRIERMNRLFPVRAVGKPWRLRTSRNTRFRSTSRHA
jgi:hypothetical protein